MAEWGGGEYAEEEGGECAEEEGDEDEGVDEE